MSYYRIILPCIEEHNTVNTSSFTSSNILALEKVLLNLSYTKMYLLSNHFLSQIVMSIDHELRFHTTTYFSTSHKLSL